MQWLADDFILKKEDRSQKDIHILLIDYAGLDRQTVYKNPKIVNKYSNYQQSNIQVLSIFVSIK